MFEDSAKLSTVLIDIKTRPNTITEELNYVFKPSTPKHLYSRRLSGRVRRLKVCVENADQPGVGGDDKEKVQMTNCLKTRSKVW